MSCTVRTRKATRPGGADLANARSWAIQPSHRGDRGRPRRPGQTARGAIGGFGSTASPPRLLAGAPGRSRARTSSAGPTRSARPLMGACSAPVREGRAPRTGRCPPDSAAPRPATVSPQRPAWRARTSRTACRRHRGRGGAVPPTASSSAGRGGRRGGSLMRARARRLHRGHLLPQWRARRQHAERSPQCQPRRGTSAVMRAISACGCITSVVRPCRSGRRSR